MTTFDRYLLSRFLYINLVFFVAALGLFVVVDGFTNLDAFQEKSVDKATGELDIRSLLGRMVEHYTYQSFAIVDVAGPSIIVIACMATLVLMLRQGEIHPMLAAGVPTYRATISLLLGALVMNACLLANQELVIPRIAHQLIGDHGDSQHDGQAVKSQYDPLWTVHFSGAAAFPGERRVQAPEMMLHDPLLVEDYVTLRARDAIYFPPRKERSGGWLLIDPQPPIHTIQFTDEGRQLVTPQPDGPNAFVRLSVTFDQMCTRNASLRLVSSAEISRRLQQPASSTKARQSSLIHLHTRLTRPILNIIGIYLVIPLICRKDRMSAIQQMANVAICMGTTGAVYGASMGFQFLGQNGVLAAEQAIWMPLIAGAGLAGWLSGAVRT